MIALSVNLNKIALIRNSRDTTSPGIIGPSLRSTLSSGWATTAENASQNPIGPPG